VPFQDGKACVRTLGVKDNLSLDWSEQVQEVSHYLGRVATLVHGAKAKPHTKVATINMSVVLGMAYKSGGSVRPLGAINKLGRQITRMIRVAQGLTESFPYQLIRPKVGGFGIKSFSQILQAEGYQSRCQGAPPGDHRGMESYTPAAVYERTCYPTQRRVYGEGTGTFFAIDGFLTFDSPLIMAGQAFTQSAEQEAEWHKAKAQPNRDDTRGLIVEAIEETSTREESVRAGRISLEHALRHVVGLAIAKVHNAYGNLIICGVNKSIWFDSDPPT
jgi:hypothetical protein